MKFQFYLAAFCLAVSCGSHRSLAQGTSSVPKSIPVLSLRDSAEVTALEFDGGKESLDPKQFLTLTQTSVVSNAHENSPSINTNSLGAPRGTKPETADALVESNRDLKKLIQSIPSAQIRGNLIASIDQALKRTRPDGDIIAVGKIEIPDGARTLQDGTPQGGVLILQDGERKLSFAAWRGMTMNGTVYWGRESIPSSHWPWYVTSLQSGKTKTLKCLTLQHNESVIQASNKQRHHGIALPTATFNPLKKQNTFSVSTNVTCNGQPFPAHASLGLPGFTNPALQLRVDFDDGKLKVDIPKAVLETIDPLLMRIENDYCYSSYIKVTSSDLTKDEYAADPVELKLQQVMVLNTLVTNSDTFTSVNPRTFEIDAAITASPRIQHRSLINSRGNDLTAQRSEEGVTVSIESMEKYADLGKKLPKRAIETPVSSWVDKFKLQSGKKVLLKEEHYYLIEFESSQQNDAPSWALVRIEPPVSKIDHRVARQAQGKPERNLRETMIRLGRFRIFFGFFGELFPGYFNVNGPINDADAKLITTLNRKVSIRLDNNHQLSPKGIRTIAASKNVESIRFLRMKLSKNLFQQLERINASKLQLDYCQVMSGKNSINSNRLSSVIFNDCTVDPQVVAKLSGCVNLKTLTFENCEGLSGNEEVFAQLPTSVTSINLRNCKADPRLTTALKQQRGSRLRVVIADDP